MAEVGEWEDEATLASVLAFVDAFEAANEAHGGDSKVKTQSRSSSSSSAAKRRRVETKYTTKLQRMKRAELEELREQAAVLQSRLEQLKRATRTSGEIDECRQKEEWVELEEKAASQMAGRRRSEKANQLLRKRLARHAQLCKDIVKLIAKHRHEESTEASDREEKLETLSSIVETITVPFQPLSIEVSQTSLNMVLEHLVRETRHVLASAHHPESSWIETKSLDREVEIRSSTLSSCNVTEATQVFWPKPIKGYPSLFDHICISKSSCVRTSLLPVRSRGRGPVLFSTAGEVLLHAEHHARYHCDTATGRVTIVVLALIRFASSPRDILLREYFWRQIDPVCLQNHNGSVTKTCYRIVPGDLKTSELSPVQLSIMRALVQLTRNNHAVYQEYLLGNRSPKSREFGSDVQEARMN